MLNDFVKEKFERFAVKKEVKPLSCIRNVYDDKDLLPWEFRYGCLTEDERIKNLYDMDEFYFEPVQKAVNYALATKYMFDKIHIETVNYCNGKCTFCPISKTNREIKYMPKEVLERVLSEIKRINFSGRVIMHGLNEPFVDPRASMIIRKIKEAAPHCKIQVTTNGKLLSYEKFFEIKDFVDIMFINVYSEDLSIPEEIQKIIAYVNANPKYLDVVSVYPRHDTDILCQHGSYGDCGRTKFIALKTPCLNQFSILTILHNGNVVPCLTDYEERYVLGNIMQESFEEVWYGEKFTKHRNLAAKGRHECELCTNCDIF